MMRYEEGLLADHKPCAGVRADLKMCLLNSDCCKIVNNLFGSIDNSESNGNDYRF